MLMCCDSTGTKMLSVRSSPSCFKYSFVILSHLAPHRKSGSSDLKVTSRGSHSPRHMKSQCHVFYLRWSFSLTLKGTLKMRKANELNIDIFLFLLCFALVASLTSSFPFFILHFLGYWLIFIITSPSKQSPSLHMYTQTASTCLFSCVSCWNGTQEASWSRGPQLGIDSCCHHLR